MLEGAASDVHLSCFPAMTASSQSQPDVQQLTEALDQRLKDLHPGRDWPAALSTWVDPGLPWSTTAALTANLAWRQRARRRSAVPHLWPRRLDISASPSLVERHLLLNALRFDYRMRDVSLVVQLIEDNGVPVDPFARACEVAAQYAVGGEPHAQTWQRVVRDARLSTKVAHVVLLGLWLSTHPRRADLILELCDLANVKAEGGAVRLLRTSYAHRIRGQYDEALRDLDEAVTHLDPQDIDIHADLTRERQHVKVMVELGERVGGELATVRQVSREEIEQVRNESSRTLVASVEILGLFIAITAVLGTGIAGAFSPAVAFLERIVLMVVGFALAAGFFLLVRLVVRRH